MTPERQAYLFHRYFLKTATAAEEHELMQWLASQAGEEEVSKLMDEAWNEFQTQRQLFTQQQSGRMLRQILQSGTKEENVIPLQKKNHRLRFAAAAAIVVLMSATIGWLFSREEKARTTQAKNAVSSATPSVEPANDKATLTLANGERIILDDAANGNISNQSGITVIKLNGQLSYNTPGSNNTKEIIYNTITTAKGKQYKLVLEDGSSVWLNAASSLRFPVSFPGNERRVELNGEAYFEIAKDIRRPFHVKLRSSDDSNKGTVTALGTSFNINSYDNENNIKTTLLSGSVGVSNQKGKSIVLKPGQQASFNDIQLRLNPEANTEQVLAWKNNLFNFDNENIEDIMRELTRWYNIEVRFEGPIPDKHYFGSIRRQVKLTEILNMLEIAGDISFSLEGRTLLIKRK